MQISSGHLKARQSLFQQLLRDLPQLLQHQKVNSIHISLHARQQQVFDDPARYKVVAAGRRFGKSYLAAIILFVEAGVKLGKVAVGFKKRNKDV